MKRGKAISAWMLGFVFVLCVSSSVLALESGANDPDSEARKGGYKIVTTEELAGWLDEIDPRWLSDRESILIIDTMPLVESYKKNHIPYAAHFEFPAEELDRLDDKTRAEFEKVLGPDRKRKLIFYSDFTTCGRSHNGAMWAVKLGYTNVYRYPAGIRGWMDAGNATATAN